MRVVERALASPHRCAVFPQLGQAHREGYVDTGMDMPFSGPHDPHVYVSVAAVREMGRLIGMVERRELTVAEAQRDAALQRIKALEEELQEERRKVEAIDFLASKDYIARRKRGPKPAEAKAA